MKKENIHITGDLVVIKSVTENDIEDYLHIKRSATILKAEYDKENGHRPQVGLGILEDERKKGYAMEVSRLLVQRVLKHDEIECIEWMTTSGNEASNRIARKLGGRIIREEPIIPKEALEHWGDENSGETEIPCYVVYGIYRK